MVAAPSPKFIKNSPIIRLNLAHSRSLSTNLCQILLNLPVGDTVVQKHPVLIEQGLSEDGDDPADRRILVALGLVLQGGLLPPPAAAGVAGDEVDGVVHGEEEPHEGSLRKL